jgi:hypothetical protein
MTTQQFESWTQPEGTSLQDWLNTRIARFETRKYDFRCLEVPSRLRPEISSCANALYGNRCNRCSQ